MMPLIQVEAPYMEYMETLDLPLGCVTSKNTYVSWSLY